jgi:hypothetical protein
MGESCNGFSHAGDWRAGDFIPGGRYIGCCDGRQLGVEYCYLAQITLDLIFAFLKIQIE